MNITKDIWWEIQSVTNKTPEEWSKNVGEESRKSWMEKYNSGFWETYCRWWGLDIGGSGYLQDVHPIIPTAKIIDLDYPGYDGKTLPFADKSQDFIYSSHMLEHVSDYKNMIQEMFRVTRKNGYIIVVVPHKYLYEKKEELPSRFNADHKRLYTPASLLKEVEDSLTTNTYRVRHLQDNDQGHDYTDPPETHGRWQYEIELVLEKL